MIKYIKITFLAILFGLLSFPCYASAASITENSAAIGEGCVASGLNSTAMGYRTTASGYASTAITVSTTASGNYSTVIGRGTSSNNLINNIPESFMVGYMADSNDDTPELFVRDGGVGIGTTSTERKLNVSGGAPVVGMKITNTENGGEEYSLFSSSELSVIGGGKFAIYNDTRASWEIILDSTGRVGIGTTSPGYKLEVNGSAAKPGGGSWSNSSDLRLKDVQGVYHAGLDEVIDLKPITFRYKDSNSRGLPTDQEYIGFVAQEVQEVFPEAISEGPDGYLDFNMHPVNVAMVNAIKELKAENDSLKAENASLKGDIAKIKKLLGI